MDAETTTIDGQWWAALAEGKVLFQRCSRCGTANFYPRLACSECLSRDMQWLECAGTGTVYAWTRIHRAPTKELAAEAPYTVVLADMTEGFRIMTRLSRDYVQDVMVGQRIMLLVEQAADGGPELRFKPHL